MALQYVRAANPIWYLPDFSGLALNDEYYAFFLTNVFPYVPQAVYTTYDSTMAPTWPFPLQFQPGGTLPNNLYFNPDEVYRIEIRHGNTQTDPLIYEINNFIPGAGASPVVNSALDTAENQISNPQFAWVNFTATEDFPFIYEQGSPSNYTLQIAPDWRLDLVGAGSVNLLQLNIDGLTDSDDGTFPGTKTNPAYALKIVTSGWTNVFLRQRLTNTSALFTSGSIGMAATIRPHDSADTFTFAYYAAGNTLHPYPIHTQTLPPSVFTEMKFSVDVAVSDSTTLADMSYVDISITCPNNGDFDITNVQFIGHAQNLPSGFDPIASTPDYTQDSFERQLNNLYHYYSDQLITRGKNSLLTGWDFPLNPWQFYNIDGKGNPAGFQPSAKTTYVLDQTIFHLETASSLTVGRATTGLGGFLGDLVVTGYNAVADTANRFAIIQYIDPATFNGNWGTYLSCLVKAGISSTQNTALRIKMRLIYRSDLPPQIGNNEPITGWDPVTKDLTFAAGWTALTPENDPFYLLSSTYATDDGSSSLPSYSFNKFNVPDAPAITGAATMGVVLYVMDPLVTNAMAALSGSVYFHNISLVPNLFAVEANRLTYDETLRACQYYFEKSYEPATAIGDTTGVNSFSAYQPCFYDGAANTAMLPSYFNLMWKTIKRLAPVLTVYTVSDGTKDDVDGYIFEVGASLFSHDKQVFLDFYVTDYGISVSGVTYRGKAVNFTLAMGNIEISANGAVIFQYTADSRLGI